MALAAGKLVSGIGQTIAGAATHPLILVRYVPMVKTFPARKKVNGKWYRGKAVEKPDARYPDGIIISIPMWGGVAGAIMALAALDKLPGINIRRGGLISFIGEAFGNAGAALSGAGESFYEATGTKRKLDDISSEDLQSLMVWAFEVGPNWYNLDRKNVRSMICKSKVNKPMCDEARAAQKEWEKTQ